MLLKTKTTYVITCTWIEHLVYVHMYTLNILSVYTLVSVYIHILVIEYMYIK